MNQDSSVSNSRAIIRLLLTGNKTVRLLVVLIAFVLLISSVIYTQRLTGSYSISLTEAHSEASVSEVASPTNEVHLSSTISLMAMPTRAHISPWGALKDFSPSQDACKKQREFYDGKLQEYAASSTLEFDSTGEIKNEPWQLTTTQTLFDQSCWQYGEREEPYAGADTNGHLNTCNAFENIPKRTALVLRLAPDHLFTADAVHMTRQLFVEIGWRFHMDIILLENTQGDRSNVPEEFQPSRVMYDSDMIFANYTQAKRKERRINYDYDQQKGHYTQRYFQFVQAWFFEQHPQYSFAYFLDSHVRASTDWGVIFKHLFDALKEQKDPDLITFAPIRVTAPNSWDDIGPRTMPEHCCSSNLAVHGASRRLGLALRTYLDEPNNAIFNAFLPGTAIKNGFNIFMFAHPLIKSRNDLMFEQYQPPEQLPFMVLNLKSTPEEKNETVWQTSFGSFEETKRPWMDDIYQNWRTNQTRCLPGLLMFPVSGR